MMHRDSTLLHRDNQGHSMPLPETAVTVTAEPTAKKQRAPSPTTQARRLKQVQEKRQIIINAALPLFSRSGFHGVSVEQIADSADVSKTNLLYYFENKESLYKAVLQSILSLWLAPLKAFSADEQAQVAIEKYIRDKMIASRDNPDASRVFCLEVVQGAPIIGDELRHGLKDLVDLKSSVIRTWIEQGQLHAVEPYHFLFTLWSVTQHYADFAVQVKALSGKTLKDKKFFEEAVSNVQNIILHGILPRS